MRQKLKVRGQLAVIITTLLVMMMMEGWGPWPQGIYTCQRGNGSVKCQMHGRCSNARSSGEMEKSDHNTMCLMCMLVDTQFSSNHAKWPFADISRYNTYQSQPYCPKYGKPLEKLAWPDLAICTSNMPVFWDSPETTQNSTLHSLWRVSHGIGLNAKIQAGTMNESVCQPV